MPGDRLLKLLYLSLAALDFRRIPIDRAGVIGQLVFQVFRNPLAEVFPDRRATISR